MINLPEGYEMQGNYLERDWTHPEEKLWSFHWEGSLEQGHTRVHVDA